MKWALHIGRFAGHSCLLALALAQIGCSHSLVDRTAVSSVGRTPLSSEAAAELAAKLANDECERLHHKQPFSPAQYAAVLEGDLYRWGRLDPGGPAGLSAIVTFRKDGTEPDVKVYFSTDILRTRPLPQPRPFNFNR